MKVEQACFPAFARHETFQPRWAWFRKAYEHAAADPRVFLADNATLRLGVGRNMVKAIRFWGQAAKIIASAPDPSRPRQSVALPTPIGTALFADDGWDPYCEDLGTLWLLHWLFLAPPSLLPVWWIAFNEFNAIEFTANELAVFCKDATAAASSWDTPRERSVAKDVAVLSRAYAATSEVGQRVSFDDIADSPLRELRLLRSVETPHRALRFVVGPKPGLPPMIAAYACLDFLARTDAGARTATVSRLTSEPGGPGRAFRLTEDALVDLLERASESGAVQLTSPGGVSQLVFDGTVSEMATACLATYYGRPPGCDQLVAGVGAGEPATLQVACPLRPHRASRSTSAAAVGETASRNGPNGSTRVSDRPGSATR